MIARYLFIAITACLFIAVGCWQDNDNPMYGKDRPDPNPAGTPAAVLTSVNPDSAYPDASVVITGSGFNSVASENMVKFGTNVVEVTAATATQLTVTTPASSGFLGIQVAPRGAEEWSNALQFNLLSYITELTNPELLIIDDETKHPNGVDADDAGNVYFGSQADSVIYKIDPDGVKSVFASVTVAGAIHFGPGGYLYVCNRRANEIVRISPDGLTVENAVSVSNPVDFDWDADGNMYIVRNESSIYMLPPGGSVTQVASGLGSAKCCRVFEDYLYVTQVWDGNVLRFHITGSGLGPQEEYYTNSNPLAIDFDKKGVLYTTSAWEESIFLYAPGGAAEAIIYEGELERTQAIHYMNFHGAYIYLAETAAGGVGVITRVYAGIGGAPRYGQQ